MACLRNAFLDRGIMMSRRMLRIFVIVVPAGLAACSDATDGRVRKSVAGDPENGRALITAYGCGACHVVEGIRGARGKVGPALVAFAQQRLLAGFLPNSPRFLVPWLMNPERLDPETAMPAQGLSEAEARDIASYLYSLGEPPQVYPPGPPLRLGEQELPVRRIEEGDTSFTDTTPRTRRIVSGRGP